MSQTLRIQDNNPSHKMLFCYECDNFFSQTFSFSSQIIYFLECNKNTNLTPQMSLLTVAAPLTCESPVQRVFGVTQGGLQLTPHPPPNHSLHQLRSLSHHRATVLDELVQSVPVPDPDVVTPADNAKECNPQFPLDTSLLRCVSATPAELIHFTSVNVSIPTRSSALRICSVPAPAVRSPPEQIHRTSVSGRCRSTMQQFS